MGIWFRRRRTVATGFCGASLLLTLPALQCVTEGNGPSALCATWLQPPQELHRALYPSLAPSTLGTAAMGALRLYGAYLGASGIRIASAARAVRASPGGTGESCSVVEVGLEWTRKRSRAPGSMSGARSVCTSSGRPGDARCH